MATSCSSVEDRISQEVKKSNQQRAQLSSSDCILDTVIAADRTIEYYFSMPRIVANENYAMLLKEFGKTIGSDLPPDFMQYIKSNEIKILYHYRDKNAKLIKSLVFDPANQQ